MAFNKARALLEAHKYVTQGKNALAIQQYLSILENDPSDLTLLNTIGDLYIRDKNVSEGLRQFYKLAEAYVGEGFIVKAIAIYKKISKIDRNTAEPYLQLTELYLTQGLTREAREQCTNAFEFYRRAGQKDKAREVLQKLVQLDPDNPNSYLKLARYTESIGEESEAADAYLRAANAAQERGDIPAAESAISKAEKFVPASPELLLSRARQAFHNQQPEQVERILASAPHLQGDPRTRHLLFETYLAAHDLDAAGKLLLEAFRRDLSDFSPVANYAAECIANKDYDRAFEAASSVAQDLIEQKMTGPLMEVLRKIWEAVPQRIDNLELMYSIGEKATAEPALTEILEALGHAYVQAGELAKAEQAFGTLVSRDPRNESYKDMLKQVLQKQGKEYVAPDLSAMAGAGAPLEEQSFTTSLPGAETGPQPDAAAGQAAVPAEFSMAEYSPDLSAPTEEEPLPKPQEIPWEPEPREDASHGPVAEKPEPEGEIPRFNYPESREEIEFYVGHGFHEEAEKAMRNLEQQYPEEPAVAALRRLVEESAAGPKHEAEPLETSESEPLPSPQPGVPAHQRDMPVDLAGELASTLGDIEGPESRPAVSDAPTQMNPLTQSADEASAELGGLLDELREEEPGENASDDLQTHFNLGVAFREMGLYDEAIGEFQKAVKGATRHHFPPNFLQACTLLAACFMDKGMPAIAATWYSRALEITDLDEDAVLALRYDLGAAYEQADDYQRALEKFTEVYSQNIDYRDVAEKIRTLRQKAS